MPPDGGNALGQGQVGCGGVGGGGGGLVGGVGLYQRVFWGEKGGLRTQAVRGQPSS